MSETNTEHEHGWTLPEGDFFVIDTYPQQYPYTCPCGAFTHNPETGAPCRICNPLDYEKRTTDRITLSGGPFDGIVIARPMNHNILFRCDDKRVQKIVKYQESFTDRSVWKFYWNDWTHPAPGSEQ